MKGRVFKSTAPVSLEQVDVSPALGLETIAPRGPQ